MLERTTQLSSRPTAEFTRTPPSLETPPELPIDESVVEPQKLKPTAQAVLAEKTSSSTPSATDYFVDSFSSSSLDPRVSPATDGSRSIPPSEIRQLTSSKIPSSKIGRLFHYGGKPLPCVTLAQEI